MKKKPRSNPTTESHRYQCICVAKINSFRRLGKIAEAKDWAGLLLKHLKSEGLVQ